MTAFAVIFRSIPAELRVTHTLMWFPCPGLCEPAVYLYIPVVNT